MSARIYHVFTAKRLKMHFSKQGQLSDRIWYFYHDPTNGSELGNQSIQQNFITNQPLLVICLFILFFFWGGVMWSQATEPLIQGTFNIDPAS